MSTKSGNAGCGKVIGYVLLVGLGLLLLRSVYYALSYVGLNTLLALDQSAYAQLTGSHWAGYALLGFGLGAAGGAIAAQRRFGLSQSITVVSWLVIVGLLVTAYAGVADTDPNGALPETTTLPADTPEAEPDVSGAMYRRHRLWEDLSAKVRGFTVPYEQFEKDMNDLEKRGRLYTNISSGGKFHHLFKDFNMSREQFDADMTAVDPAATVMERADEATVTTEPEAAPTAPLTNETEPATDDPEADEAPASTASEDSALLDETAVPAHQPRLTGLVLPARKKTLAATLTGLHAPPAATPAAPLHPTGHHEYAGQVGSLRATYSLDWQPNGELSGSYYYNQLPTSIYRLSGATGPGVELHLVEFTRGRQTARCVLQPQGAGFAGTMVNTDGRQLAMSLE